MPAWGYNRAGSYPRMGQPVPWPQIDAGQYMIDALMDAGPTKPAPMGGDVPLDWLDISAFMGATGDITEPWEAKTLKRMSAAYWQGREEGKDVFSIAPMERG